MKVPHFYFGGKRTEATARMGMTARKYTIARIYMTA
jgi:hypothetical protein